MKLSPSHQIVSLAACASMAALFCNVVEGRSGRPPFDVAGAPPLEQTCAICHTGEGDGTLEVDFQDGGLGYVPNGLYDLRVILSEEGKIRFGFEMANRAEGDNSTTAGSWLSGEYSQVFDEGRLIGHQAAPFSDDTHTFEFQWAAPAENVGEITFYVAGIAADGDGSTEGDNTYAMSFSISAAVDPTFWGNSPKHEGGWRYAAEGYEELAGLGWIWDASWPWVYTLSQNDPETGEWIWVAQGNANGFWGYNSTDDFWFWADVVSGWYYSYDESSGGWHAFAL